MIDLDQKLNPETYIHKTAHQLITVYSWERGLSNKLTANGNKPMEISEDLTVDLQLFIKGMRKIRISLYNDLINVYESALAGRLMRKIEELIPCPR